AVSPAGNYIYRTTFNLPFGYDPSAASISGKFGTDNSLASIQINGITLPIIGGGFSSLTPFTLNSGFMAGANTLDFNVTNGASPAPNPTGLRVDDIGLTDTVILINGSGQDDHLIVNADSANSGSFQLYTDGNLVQSG